MSYKQHFHDQIHYSGSKTVSYPSSQSGGTITVNYSGSIPLDITVNVNTTPLDNSVSKVNRNVDVLGGAVVAMEAAQCAVIHQGAKEISQSLIDGFFGTINTELSQQIQALDSAINAGLGLLLEQGKAVTNQKNVMETDYHRISSRYHNLFMGLDEDCRKRIYSLDKNAFMLSEQVKGKLLFEGYGEGAKNYIAMQEESSLKMMITVSGMIRKVCNLMQSLYGYVIQETTLSSLANTLLSGEAIETLEDFFIPVIFTEDDVLDGNGSDEKCFLADGVQNKSVVIEQVSRFCKDSTLSSWDAQKDEEKEMITKELRYLVENSLIDSGTDEEKRIYNELMMLWQNSNLNVIKRRE